MVNHASLPTLKHGFVAVRLTRNAFRPCIASVISTEDTGVASNDKAHPHTTHCTYNSWMLHTELYCTQYLNQHTSQQANKPQKPSIKRKTNRGLQFNNRRHTNTQRFPQVFFWSSLFLDSPTFPFLCLACLFGMCVLRPQGMTNPPQNPHAGAFVCMLKHEGEAVTGLEWLGKGEGREGLRD